MKATHASLPEPGRKYRLITRSDMDGLICAVILRKLDLIDDVLFAHPKDMQDAKIPVTDNDITTNLPYVEGVHLCFDHHASELERLSKSPPSHVIDPRALSAARVVYDYFGGVDNPKLQGIAAEMMDAVDKADSANFTREEILNPENWALLSFVMDARTGLGRFREFSISNYQLMTHLMDQLSDNKTIQDILSLPDVRERIDLYFNHQLKCREQIERCADVHGPLVILDYRQEETIWAGNRFVVYALFPQCNISMHVLWGKNKQNTVLAVGKSILNRTSKVNIGKLMLEHGGGGHEAAGTCQIENLRSEEAIQDIIERIDKSG